LQRKYDYVIVGGGSAGCVLANRLSANPNVEVLLLEAGPRDWHPMIHIPVGYAYNLKRSTFNWMYHTEPEPGADGRQLYWPRGKVLGGSSSINGMIHVRGQSRDYDHWRELGNDGWGWSDVLPYFKRLENFGAGTGDTRGAGGPIHISMVERHPVSDAFLSALQGSGLHQRDTNSGEQEGYSYVESAIKNGRRQSTAVAYLNPVKRRRNLHIVTAALVDKILFEGRRAVGVRYDHHGARLTAQAGKEVILSAGSINSPQLLELSGIGRADVLSAAGVTVLAESRNVGENLQDHYSAFCAYRVLKPVTINEMSRGLPFLREVFKYAASRTGLLTLAPAHVLAFLRTADTLRTPDLQIAILPATLDSKSHALEAKPGMTCAPYQLRPESRGSIHIASNDARTPPKIRGNYLTAELDQQILVKGLRLSRRICTHPALAQFRGAELLPGEGNQSDAELLAFARESGSTLYHPTSTCRMGSDESAVVDTRLRVNGVVGLRIVDASVMPTLISGNTNSPTVMIAEKASGMILADA
jgi:choline dehydrogenase